jgi:hypothetical protein
METYNLTWQSHREEAFKGFVDLRGRSSYLDVIIHCDTVAIKAHRLILAACSSYFERLLDSVSDEHSRYTVIALTRIDVELLKLIIEFVYNGKVTVPCDKLEEFMALAELLEIKGLRSNSASETPEEEEEQTEETPASAGTTSTKRPAAAESNAETPVLKTPKVDAAKIKEEFVDSGVESDQIDQTSQPAAQPAPAQPAAVVNRPAANPSNQPPQNGQYTQMLNQILSGQPSNNAPRHPINSMNNQWIPRASYNQMVPNQQISPGQFQPRGVAPAPYPIPQQWTQRLPQNIPSILSSHVSTFKITLD